MSVPDNYEIIQVVSSNATIRVDIDWEYQSIDELYVWQQDSATGDIFYFNLGDFAVVEKSDGSGDYIEVENVATAEAVVFTARNTAKTQTYELENSEPLDPVALIEALDKAIKLIQENYSQLGTPDKRAITSVNPFEIPDKQTRKLTYVSFDENGDLRLDDEIDKIVGWAKEWAINPEDDLVSTEAGGNGVDDYSSLHHSRKSEGFSDDSESSANDSASSANDSANSATASANSATSSANSASASATSASNALASENKANLWAEEAVDVPVETGEYSAYHWAQKALENAGGGLLFTEYFDGFQTNGTHVQYNGDIDIITVNSIYNCAVGLISGDIPPFPSQGFFFLHTMIFTNTSASLTQMAYSINSGEGVIFSREKVNGVFTAWKKLALADDFVPLAGNIGNPMTGNLYMGNKIIIDAQSMEMGRVDQDSTPLIDLRASSDPSQSDYSARIIRNSGVNGSFSITNLGSGTLVLDPVSGALSLRSGTGLIFVNGNRINNLANPISATDAATKAYVDARVASGRWATVTDGTTTPVITSGSGISSITLVGDTYTATLASAINVNKDIALSVNTVDNTQARNINFLKATSTTTSIIFELIGRDYGANDTTDFTVTITELL